MKLSVREEMVPGSNLTEKFRNLKKLGFDGIEIGPSSRHESIDEIKQATEETGVQPSITTPIGGGALVEMRKEERDRAMTSSRTALEIASEIGAVGTLSVPLFHTKMESRPRLPDLSPWMSTVELEKKMMVTLYGELAAYAASLGNVAIIIEPLNRYEQWYPCRIEEAIEICEAVNNPHCKIMGDFFHMNFEEADMSEAICSGGDFIANIHIADSQRRMPPRGHTDFSPGFQALKEIGYDNFCGLEGTVTGNPMVDLAQCAGHLHSVWDAA